MHLQIYWVMPYHFPRKLHKFIFSPREHQNFSVFHSLLSIQFLPKFLWVWWIYYARVNLHFSDEVEHLFMFTGCWDASSVRHLSISFAYFSWVVTVLLIIYSRYQSFVTCIIYLLTICGSPFFLVFFDKQKFLNFILVECINIFLFDLHIYLRNCSLTQSQRYFPHLYLPKLSGQSQLHPQSTWNWFL